MSNPHTSKCVLESTLNSAKYVVSLSFIKEKNFVSQIIDHSALSMMPVVYDTNLHTYSGFPVAVVIPDITVAPEQGPQKACGHSRNGFLKTPAHMLTAGKGM